MDYYKQCIKTIQSHIENKEYQIAIEKLHAELSMPYIPQDYQTQFESMLMDIKQSYMTSTNNFTDIQEIKEAILKGGMLKAKALHSLETLNLRLVVDDLKEILKLDIDDIDKRFIIMMLLEQEISCQCEITLDNKTTLIDTSKIENPFTNKHYQKIFIELEEMLSSYDPSLLKLCHEELSMQIMKHFPFINKELNADQILKNVNRYMNIV